MPATTSAVRPLLLLDGDGVVAFETLFPAAYAGRWPHLNVGV